MSEKILYGFRETDGETISILDVPLEEYGRRCRCLCPYCKIPLQANSLKEEKRTRYFRHDPKINGDLGGNGNGCSEAHANESGLHKMAKNIIAEGKVCIPAKEIPLGKLKLGLPEYIRREIPNSYVVQEATVLNCDEVRVEEKIENFRSDATVVSQGKEYIIEIFVKHRTSDEKIEKIEKTVGYPTLEINLSYYANNPINEEDLRSLLISKTDFREWIYYPNESELIEEAKQFFEGLDVVKKYREQQKRKNHETKDRKEQLKLSKKEIAIRNCNYLFQPDNYAKELIRLRNDRNFYTYGYTKDALGKFQLYFLADYKEVPFFVDIPITGEILFQCDRRIWQGQIFDRYVYKRTVIGDYIPKNKIFNKLNVEHKIKINWNMVYKMKIDSLKDEEIHFPFDVIKTYLEYLEYLGFIENEKDSEWARVVNYRSIEPLNMENAKKLQAAIKSVNILSPNVNDSIRSKL